MGRSATELEKEIQTQDGLEIKFSPILLYEDSFVLVNQSFLLGPPEGQVFRRAILEHLLSSHYYPTLKRILGKEIFALITKDFRVP